VNYLFYNLIDTLAWASPHKVYLNFYLLVYRRSEFSRDLKGRSVKTGNPRVCVKSRSVGSARGVAWTRKQMMTQSPAERERVSANSPST